MKMFFLTLFLFILMLFLIITNAIYIKRMTSEMDDRIERLSDVHSSQCVKEIAALQKYWEKQMPLVSLSASFFAVDRTTEQLSLLLVAAKNQDLYGYCSALAMLTDAVGDLRRMEGIGFAVS